MQTKRALLKSLTRAVRVVTGAAARAVARMEKKAAVYFSKSWLEKMEPWLWRHLKNCVSTKKLVYRMLPAQRRLNAGGRRRCAWRQSISATETGSGGIGACGCVAPARCRTAAPLLFLNFGGHCRRSVWRGQRMRQRRGVVLRPLLSLICRRLLTAAQDCRSVRCASRCRAIPQGPQMMKRCCACFGSGWVMWPMTKRSPSLAKKP